MAGRKQMIATLKARIDRGDFGNRTFQVVAPPALQPQELFLQIGRKRYQVASIEHAVAMHAQARDAAEHGASGMPRVTIVSNTGTHLYGISYNGRVWDGDRPLDGLTTDQWVAGASA